MRGIAIYAVMALFRTRDLVSDLSARLPTLQGFPMCEMLSRFHERQEILDTESTLQTPSLQCRPFQ